VEIGSSFRYVAWMDENSPQGQALVFNDPYIAEIRDDDLVSVNLLCNIA
jgi:hypothetical protein